MKWSEPQLEELLTIRGGFATRAYALKTHKETLPTHGDVTFVHIAKQEEWILQMVTGKLDKNTLKRSQFFNTLKQRVIDRENCGSKTDVCEAAVAAEATEVDPMNFLDAVEPDSFQTPKKRKGHYRSVRSKNRVTLVTMPEKEPNKFPRHTAVHEVMVLPLSTNAVWMRKEDVPWMIEYLVDEVGPAGSQGVPAIAFEEDEEGQANCAVDGIRMEWDFEDSWTATAVRGPLQGQSWRCKASTLTPAKWASASAIHNYGIDFGDASPEDRKRVAHDYLENFCRQRLTDACTSP